VLGELDALLFDCRLSNWLRKIDRILKARQGKTAFLGLHLVYEWTLLNLYVICVNFVSIIRSHYCIYNGVAINTLNKHRPRKLYNPRNINNQLDSRYTYKEFL